MLIIKWTNRAVIVASLIVLMRASGKGFSKDIFYFPCSFEINNMCSGYCHFLPVMFWILAGLWCLPVFSQSIVMDLGQTVIFLIWSSVSSNRPAPASTRSISQTFSLGSDSLGVNWCQHCNCSGTQNLHILDYFRIFRLLLQKKTKCSHSICKGYPGTM